MRGIDLSSWHGILATVIGLGLITLIGVGVRLLMMMTIQQRRERRNRQINERLRALIAAYKVLGGSFTGELSVDPAHLRDLRNYADSAADIDRERPLDLSSEAVAGSNRRRRIRDAVEAALSDIVLLGTDEHVRLAERAANELVAGRQLHTQELVVSLRDFIRKALDLEPIPRDLSIPTQGPTRPAGSGGRDRGDARQGGGQRSGSGGGQGGAGGMGMGAGMGMGVGASMGPDGDTDGGETSGSR